MKSRFLSNMTHEFRTPVNSIIGLCDLLLADRARYQQTVFEKAPGDIVRDIHAAIRDTRGAAVAGFAADVPARVARYCGVGNISGMSVVSKGTRLRVLSHNGTAGHGTLRMQEIEYPFRAGAMLVMHPDGVGLQPPARRCHGCGRQRARGSETVTRGFP